MYDPRQSPSEGTFQYTVQRLVTLRTLLARAAHRLRLCPAAPCALATAGRLNCPASMLTMFLESRKLEHLAVQYVNSADTCANVQETGGVTLEITRETTEHTDARGLLSEGNGA